MSTPARYSAQASVTGVHNLPSMQSAFIGRHEELARAAALLEKERLITITGMGGVGKSRLAIQAASMALEHFRDGICYLSLIPLDSPELLASSLLDALSTPFAGQQSPDVQLLNTLRDREQLLVLDNYEHLLPETDLVVDILGQAVGGDLLGYFAREAEFEGRGDLLDWRDEPA